MRSRRWVILTLGVVVGLVAMSAEAGTLETIRGRGKVKCGVTSSNVPGLAYLDDKGRWMGFDVDYCRGLAAGILGSGEAVEFAPLQFAQALPALKSGEIDVAARAITFTIGRDTELGFHFVGPTLFSGQAFMVHKRTGVKELKGLNGASICVEAGTIMETLISDYFRARNMTFKPVSVDNNDTAMKLYESGRCDVMTMEPPFLAVRRSRMQDPSEHIILPELYAKSHMGPVIRQADEPFNGVARWTHYGMVTAEELGITQANVEQMRSSRDPQTRRFLGLEGNIGSKMGVSDDWMMKVIKAVGNYGEIWERNFGMQSPLKLPRGINALERDGGLQFAPSWR